MQSRWNGIRVSLIAVLALFSVITATMQVVASTCSLADHIRSANTNTSIGGCPQGTSHDVITINEDITLSEALPPIAGTITIEGNGHSISGDGKYRIFDVVARSLTINNLTLTDGKAPDDQEGGAIRLRNSASVVIENSRFRKNSAFRGGAIASMGGNTKLTVRQSRFRFNLARSGAGAVSAGGGSVDITGSSFEHNRVTRRGGAIETLNGQVSVANSSFFRNQAGDGGAVSVSGGETTLTHVTMVVNLARRGESLQKSGGRLNVRNSIILNGQPSYRSVWSCTGGLDQSVGNLSQDGSCEEVVEGDPMLHGMTDSPAYFPLKDRSPAVDAAAPEFCLETDQVGTARPQGDGCDIGAIEAIDTLPPLPSFEPPPPCPFFLKIVAANTDAPAGACPAGNGHDVITLSEDITLDRELPPITDSLTIEGNGHSISGGSRLRIFTVSAGTLTIKNLKLIDAWASNGKGGAIRIENSGRAVIEGSSFISNLASWGGAIATEGELTVKNSSFQRNSCGGGGGAILVEGGAVDISGSSFEFNQSSLYGGAIEVLQGSVSVSNSSFHGNDAREGGAIIVGGGETTLTHLTFIANQTYMGADSLSIKGGRLLMRNSIVAGDFPTASCDGPLTQSIGNLSQDGTCADGAAVDPMLERRTSAFGYFPLKSGSPAIDAADPRYCLPEDQVGTPRPQGGGCDIGASEWSAGGAAQQDPGASSRDQSTCTLTTTHALDFRDGPGGTRIGAVPNNSTMSATARTAGWFQVEYRGAAVWISADYVVAQGVCG